VIIGWEEVGKLLLAVLIGGIIGAEREFHHKAAGFRTLIFICLGAALFTMVAIKLSGAQDATRIIANIVSGVGFLGAGVIMHDSGRVVGLTTAAAIWLTAALGMGIAVGEYGLVSITAVLAVVVLWFFPRIELYIDKVQNERVYEVLTIGSLEIESVLTAVVQKSGLSLRGRRWVKTEQGVLWTLFVVGPRSAHEMLSRLLLGDPRIKEFRLWS